MQKTVGVDFLEKTRKANEGEAPQYRVTNSHEAIIRPEVFDLAQSMLREYREREGIRNCAHAFSSRVFCGECYGQYGVKAWRSSKNGQPITRYVWQCNKKYKTRGNVNCHTPHLTEAQLEYAFNMAFNRIIGDKDRYIAEYEPVIASLTNNAALEAEAVTLREQLDELYTLIKNCIEEQAQRGGDSTLTERHAQLTVRYEAAKSRLGEISAEMERRAVKRTRILAFLADLREQDALLTEFNENLFRATVDRIIVNRESEVIVEFRDGRQICVSVIGR